MIDKLGNINAGSNQNKRISDDSRAKDVPSKAAINTEGNSKKSAADVKISSELNVKDMSSEAPINKAKVSAIKDAIAKGAYPIDLDKVAEALLQAYQDIK